MSLIAARKSEMSKNILHEYVDYEISAEDRENINWIDHYLHHQLYESRNVLKEHILILEHMQTRVVEALQNEESIGFLNTTLQYDYHRIKHLLQQLEAQLTIIEEKK